MRYHYAEALIIALEQLDPEGFYEIDYERGTVAIDTYNLKMSTLESLLAKEEKE